MANDVVYMNKDAWTGILDQIRESSGNTDKMTASQAKQVIAGLSSGGLSEITDASYLFCYGVRLADIEAYMKLVKHPTSIDHMFSGLNSSVLPAAQRTRNYFDGVDVSKCEDASSAFSDCASSATVNDAVCRAYPLLKKADYMFEKYSGKVDKITISLTNHWCTAQNMFRSSSYKLDFTGSDLSGVVSAYMMFYDCRNVNVPIIIPDYFLSHCYDSRLLFSSVGTVGTVAKVIKLPNGFMSSPVEPYNDTEVYMQCERMFYCTEAYVIDINSDFMATPARKDLTPTTLSDSVGNFREFAKAYSDDLKALIMRFSTVIPFESLISSNQKSVRFFVPRALVDTYKAATNWSAMADRIFSVEDYTKDGTIDGDFDYDKAGISLT